jgi:hypothetical protein
MFPGSAEDDLSDRAHGRLMIVRAAQGLSLLDTGFTAYMIPPGAARSGKPLE